MKGAYLKYFGVAIIVLGELLVFQWDSIWAVCLVLLSSSPFPA